MTFKAFRPKWNAKKRVGTRGGEGGVLCYVVKLPYKGIGKPVFILHEATPEVLEDGRSGFAYGNKRLWVIGKQK